MSGERGDQGQRGISGERGPKGDHGQTGDRGLTGHIGPRGRGVAVLFVITMIYVTGGWWLSERDSCQRQDGVRSATRTFASTAYDARTADAKLDLKHHNYARYIIDHKAALKYRASVKEAHALNCMKVFPDK